MNQAMKLRYEFHRDLGAEAERILQEGHTQLVAHTGAYPGAQITNTDQTELHKDVISSCPTTHHAMEFMRKFATQEQRHKLQTLRALIYGMGSIFPYMSGVAGALAGCVITSSSGSSSSSSSSSSSNAHAGARAATTDARMMGQIREDVHMMKTILQAFAIPLPDPRDHDHSRLPAPKVFRSDDDTILIKGIRDELKAQGVDKWLRQRCSRRSLPTSTDARRCATWISGLCDLILPQGTLTLTRARLHKRRHQTRTTTFHGQPGPKCMHYCYNRTTPCMHMHMHMHMHKPRPPRSLLLQLLLTNLDLRLFHDHTSISAHHTSCRG